VLKISPCLLEQIEDIENELFDNSWNAGTLEREFAEDGQLWVAGDPVEGYLLARTEEGLTDILRLGVKGACQGKGVGTQLLRCALRAFPRVMLSVRKNNQRAIRLYDRHGFKVLSDLGSSWVMFTCSEGCTGPRSAGTE